MQRPQWTRMRLSDEDATKSRFSRLSFILRRPWVIIVVVFVCFTGPFLFFSSTVPVQRFRGWLTGTTDDVLEKVGKIHPEYDIVLPTPPPEIPGFFDWNTKSSFNPVRYDDVANRSLEELCAGWPEHLLSKIQPVLKTGHGVLDARVGPQLQSVSACLINLLIFSDTDEHYKGQHLFDVIKDIPPHLRDNEYQLATWRAGKLADGTASSKEGWKTDKFKFLTGVSRAWQMRPDREWYVFYEADTYIVWDNIFRFLEHFDPDEPHYFGSPSPGRQKTWFGYGGAGYVISRAAMLRLVREDYDESGTYLGSKLSERNWHNLQGDCCGDSILGWALVRENVTLEGLSPMFTDHPPHNIPFSGQTKLWCQPVIAFHRPSEEDILGLWRWQWEHRTSERPLLYRDLATKYFNLTTLTTRSDWNTAKLDAPLAEYPSDFYTHDPHASTSACATACEAAEQCFTWTYHLRQCYLGTRLRYGYHMEPGLMSVRDRKKPQLAEDHGQWTEDDLRFFAGWNHKKIQKWVEERPCEEVEWVRPSTSRIY